jgi:hypothetical protein
MNPTALASLAIALGLLGVLAAQPRPMRSGRPTRSRKAASVRQSS